MYEKVPGFVPMCNSSRLMKKREKKSHKAFNFLHRGEIIFREKWGKKGVEWEAINYVVFYSL